MADGWTTLAANDLKKVIDHLCRESADQNTDATANSGTAFDPTLDTRAGELIELAVTEFRQSVKHGARYPISVTEAKVAPEAVIHCLNWAAWRLVTSSPNLKFVIITEQGVSSPYQRLYQEAVDYFKGLSKGMPVQVPDDPTGKDYATAVDVDDNPAIQGIRWGDTYGDADDYAGGENVDPVTGEVTGLPLNFRI